MCERDWIVDRVKLYDLRQQNPETPIDELAAQIGRSPKWVRKWLGRFDVRVESKENIELFASESRARKTTPKRVTKEVEQAILKIRDEPPENLGRVPGPDTILYFLSQDEELKAKGVYLPKSVRTVWQILVNHRRIDRRDKPARQPEEPSVPMADWQADFKSISSVPAEEEGKQQHVVETFNVIDKGTSILVGAIPRADFQAHTVIETLADLFAREGLPRTLRFDRDTRFVGSSSARDFPSAMIRFLLSLEVTPIVCPPHRPQKNAYVERYNGTYKRECLAQHQPTSLGQTIEVTEAFKYTYNYKRPNQAVTCQNQPPREAFPYAQTARTLPAQVNPDAWLSYASRRVYKRQVNSSGSIQIGRNRYYVGQAYHKRPVLIRVLPQEKHLAFFDDTQLIKKQPIKRLQGSVMLLEDYVDLMCEEALAEARTLTVRQRAKQRAHIA